MSCNCFWDRNWGRVGNVSVSYWPIFSVPEVFAKVNSTQISSRFYSGELIPNKDND